MVLPPAAAADVDRWWQAFLRRFDLEHTFGCSNRPSAGPAPAPHPEPADRWTWLILAAYTQLRLARTLTADLRRPWEKPAARPAGSPQPASAADFGTSARKPPARPRTETARPGPGRPPGVPNKPQPPRPDVGKTATTRPNKPDTG